MGHARWPAHCNGDVFHAPLIITAHNRPGSSIEGSLSYSGRAKLRHNKLVQRWLGDVLLRSEASTLLHGAGTGGGGGGGGGLGVEVGMGVVVGVDTTGLLTLGLCSS